MPLLLHYNGDTTLPVEVEHFTPDWARDKSLAEIERFEIHHGNQALPLAEFFRVSGDPSESVFEFTGNLQGVHWIGAHMQSGTIHIAGSAGRHVGRYLRGGEIHVAGDAGDWLGAELKRGLIHVRGNAGHHVGSAARGATKGMTGGAILIEGNAGDEIGHSMRRGLIAVGGSVGELAGFRMIAGTIVVFGSCGIRPGAGMKRGTLALLGPKRPSLLPTFRYASTLHSPILPLLLRHVRALGMSCDESLLQAEYEFFQGDLVSLGRGEIIFRRPV